MEIRLVLEQSGTKGIVIADANFPAASIASHCPGGLIRLDGTVLGLLQL